MATKEIAGSVREKILKAAVRLLGDCGIKKLAQPQIAKKAGVPQGHMTYYFPTRADLLVAVAERSLQSIANAVLKNVANHVPTTAKETLGLIAPVIKDKSRTRMLVGLLVESDQNPKLRASLQNQMDTSLSLVAAVLNKDKAHSDVILARAALLGLGIHYYLTDQEKNSDFVERSLEVLVDKFREKS